MEILIKSLFKVVGRILLSACSDKVIEYVIFWLLDMAAGHSKTDFDNELVTLIKAKYKDQKDANTNTEQS